MTLVIVSRQKIHNGLSAPEYVLQTITQKKESIDYRKYDEFWIIVDTDTWDLEEIIEMCNNNEIPVIISNPCFEIWILFHYLNRNQVNTIKPFKDCKSVKRAPEMVDNHFGKNYPINRKTFNGLQKAIWIAKKLDINPREVIPNNPCSRMYKLIEKLQANK